MLVGKQIIVQVVDTVYTSGDSFTILIPGGGWTGTANGCISQYGSSYSWGTQYHGVSQRSDCDRIPSTLQQGCYWRFDWLLNVENPNVRYRSISCPTVLTTISGCSRQST